MTASNIKITALFLRLALGTAYLSSVASRFQIWPQELGGGGWGNFLGYTAELNPWAPASVVSYLGWTATAAETALGILLVIGFRQRLTGFLSGVLLLIFALSMTVGTGVKSPFDYSVYTAAAASFLLAVVNESSLGIDAFLNFRRKTA